MMHMAVPDRSIPWDDVTGEPDDPDEVQKVRRLEIDYFRQKWVYQKVPASEARSSGRNILRTRCGN